MHCGEHWIRDLVGSKDRVPTSGVMADYDPFGSPVTGAIAHQRLSVTCDGKPYLASCQLVRPKELDTTNSVLDPVKVESDSSLGIPIWSFLHFHMMAAADIHRDASHCGRNNGVSGKVGCLVQNGLADGGTYPVSPQIINHRSRLMELFFDQSVGDLGRRSCELADSALSVGLCSLRVARNWAGLNAWTLDVLNRCAILSEPWLSRCEGNHEADQRYPGERPAGS